ncbi:MAG: DUF3352 domain-containing protein [Armatimonadota bacterium]|nr:DUF3352 domain-containing protein [bacterium]
MDEQVNTTHSRSTKTIPMIALIMLVAASGIGAYIMIARYMNVAVDPATYIPRDVTAAVTVDVRPTKGKYDAYKIIESLFVKAGVKHPEDNILKKIDDSLGIDTRRDALCHLSGVGAAAVLTGLTEDNTPQIVAMIGTRGDGHSRTLMATFGTKLNAKEIEFRRSQYRDFYYYYIPSQPDLGRYSRQISNYVGAVRSAIVYSNSEDGFKKVVDTVMGKPSLLSDANFTRLRKADGATLANTYFSGASYYKLISPIINRTSTQITTGAPDTLRKSMENNVAAVGNISIDSSGIKFELKGITKEPCPVLSKSSIDELVFNAPIDSAIVFAVGGWDEMWEQFRQEVESSPEMSSRMTLLTSQVKNYTGVDPVRDVLDRITMVTGYYTPAPTPSSAFPGSLTFVLRVDRPDIVKASMKKIHTVLGVSGGSTPIYSAIDPSATTIVPLGPGGESFGDTITGNNVLLNISGSNGTRCLQNAVRTCHGETPNLITSPRFRKLKPRLLQRADTLIYIDTDIMMSAFKKSMSPKDRKLTDAITFKINAIGITAAATGTEYEMRAIAPFRK